MIPGSVGGRLYVLLWNSPSLSWFHSSIVIFEWKKCIIFRIIKKNWNAKWNKVDSLHSWITFWYRQCYYKYVRNRDLNGLYIQHDDLFYKYREVPFIFVKMTCPIHIYFSVIIENYIIWPNKLSKSWFKKIVICRKQVYHLSIQHD